MRRKKLLFIIVLAWGLPVQQTFAQAQELEQLSLNITKLLQFRKILADMKEGYAILVKGYGVVKDLSQGSFDLHQTFLDGLLQVSPTVRKYERIARIIQMQAELVRDYKSAQQRFSVSGLLNPDELEYIGQVYSRLFRQSLHHVSDLAMVITAEELRMSDAERLAEIDRIYTDQRDQLSFLEVFNTKNAVLLVQRAKDRNNVNSYRYWYDK